MDNMSREAIEEIKEAIENRYCESATAVSYTNKSFTTEQKREHSFLLEWVAFQLAYEKVIHIYPVHYMGDPAYQADAYTFQGEWLASATGITEKGAYDTIVEVLLSSLPQ